MVDYVDYTSIYADSFWRATSTVIEGRGFFDRFYENFLASSPEASEKFKGTDFFSQKKMLHDSLVHLQKFSISKRADVFMKELAKKHSSNELDVQPYLYDLWLASLIDTVKEYDPEFDGDMEVAWRMHLAPGIEFMKFSHDK